MPDNSNPSQTIQLKIKRQEGPEATPYWEEFEIPYQPHMNVVSCLMEIRKNPVIQRAVLRRPGMGYTGNGWYRNGRTFYGNKERLSFPSYTGEHGTFTRAKPDSIIFF